MKNVFKKVLFSLGAVSIVGAGSLGMTNAGINDVPNTSDPYCIGNECVEPSDQLIHTIKNFINWILGLLSVIALAICLRGGFQMLTAAGDETKYKKGFTILKQAGFGLAIIGLSWLIVSLVFWIINSNTTSGM